MADIFDFPRDARNVARADGKGADMGGEAPQTMLMRPQGVPDQVWNAVLSVDCMRRLKGMTYREIPVPNSMANFGIGVDFHGRVHRPMAKVLVRRESRNANSLDTLCRALASHIDKDAERRRFMADAGF